MLVALWECKLPPLNHTGKYQKLTTDFQKILSFGLGRGFQLVLPLGVTTPHITPVMGNSWRFIFEKKCFDILKSIGFVHFLRLFSSSRRSDRVYLGWFVWDSVAKLFMMQGSRRSVQAHEGFGSIGSTLSSGFCVCRPGQYNMICWELILVSGFFAFLWLIVWGMESINVAGILQEAGDADWRAYTRSQV